MSIYDKNADGIRPCGFVNSAPVYSHDEFVITARRNPEILNVNELIRFLRKNGTIKINKYSCFAQAFLECYDVQSHVTNAEYALLLDFQKEVRTRKASKIKYTNNSTGGRDYTRDQVLDILSNRKRDMINQHGKRNYCATLVQKAIRSYIKGERVVVQYDTVIKGGYDNVSYFYSDGSVQGASYSND